MLDGKIIAFIGGGNMAEAIIKGLLAGRLTPGNIVVAEPDAGRRDLLASAYSVRTTADNRAAVSSADIVILAVKPQVAPAVIDDLKEAVGTALVISIMAGISTASIEGFFGGNVRVVRVMPNTPALIQAAASALCAGDNATAGDMETANAIFSMVGETVVVPEKQMDAVTALSGSGPAYVFAFLEALSDGGVKNGLPRDVATKLAVQTVIGAARLVAETGKHPALLREQVTSPGGTTIAGLHALESGALRSVVVNAVDAACKRSKELSG